MMYRPNAEGPLPAQRCQVCGIESRLVASELGVCLDCIRRQSGKALAVAGVAHRRARQLFDLPEQTPRTTGGQRCQLCAHECTPGEGERGYCNLREVRGGMLRHLAGTPRKGLLHWYRDPLPTNCVADPFCSGHAQGGKHNLAVFYAACTLNCLFCQNWQFREVDPLRSEYQTAAELACVANARTHCVCYFGGDPASQMSHALAASHLLAQRGVRICWETNGTAHTKQTQQAIELSLATGGCVKFDLKAFDGALHQALTGMSNARTLENFILAAERFQERPDPPLLVASTLLVPGYVDVEEVARIARFVAGLDPAIPYVLLGFAPQFLFADLPVTSVRHAREAKASARAAGLQRVHIGNRHLLSQSY